MGDDAVREYLHKDEPRGFWAACVNPFTRVDGWAAMGLGALVVAGTVLVAVLGRVHFDGVMDLHVGAGAKPGLFAFEAVVDWLIVALVFWAAGAIFAKPLPRGLDFFGMLGIGRLPFLLAGLVWIPSLLGGLMDPLAKVLLSAQSQPDQLLARIMAVQGIWWVVAGVMVTMAIMVWGMFLNYFAVKEASGLETGPAVGVFAVGTLVAEIVSKVAIVAALHAMK